MLYFLSISPDFNGDPHAEMRWKHVTTVAWGGGGISVILIALSKWYLRKKENIVESLRQDLSACKEMFDPTLILDIFTGYLYFMSSGRLGFGSKDGNSERITLYIYDNEKLVFIPFSRVSQNPKYKKKGRQEYPAGEGCIGRAWENGWCFDNNFPDNDREYNRYSKENYNMAPDVTKALGMRSNLLACMRIENDDNPLGVIVVESTERNRYLEDDIKKILEGERHCIHSMLKKWHHLVPKVFNAAELGL